jgi:pentatricopeptide repeat-containing protein PET309
MLERATVCAEPGISLFFRRIERPPRSRRTLHPAFWRQAAETRSTPAWWPAYLQDVANLSLTETRARLIHPNAFELVTNDIYPALHTKLLSACQRQTADAAKGVGYGPYALQSGSRTFSISQGNRDATLLESHGGEVPEQERFHHISPDGDDVRVADALIQSTADVAPYSGVPVNMPLLSASQTPEYQPPSDSLRALLESDDAESYGKAWQLFIRIGGQAEFAGDMLLYLSTSPHRIDLDHAIRAYKFIPTTNRGLRHYQAAIKAACARKQQRLAVEIHSEALAKGFHTEITNSLFGFLIRNGLWKTAAQVWDRLPSSQKNAADPRNSGLWHGLDPHTKLPERLLQLMKRLDQNAAIFVSERIQILGLGVQLLYRIFLSSEIMARITGPGTLALLDTFHYLGLLKPQHYFSGIQTLNKMAGSRNRHQLATLLYRNLDMRFPRARLPRSVLGSLLAILCESSSNHMASRVVLHRFAADWGKPDPLAYQKVLSAYAQNGDSTNVHEVFAEYCGDYGKPTQLEYITPLLYVYARVGDVLETRRQFERLHSDFTVEANTYCWNILITAHARARDHEGAFQTFREMKRAGKKPDHYTYGILMGICASSGDTEAVHRLVEAARQRNISGTSAMVESLVHSYCLNDEVEDAETLIEAATQMRLEGSPTRMWNILLRYHAFRADTDAVLNTQERMKELSVPADEMTYAALMQSLVNIGKTQDAASILRSLHFSNAVTATLFHYSIVLYGYALENNRDMVAVIYHEMLERFPRTSLSARLSRLRSYVHRDTNLTRSRLNQALQGKPMSKDLRLSKTLDYLAEILLDVDRSDLATKEPQPGLGRRSPPEAFPSIYMEFVIAAMGRSGALQKAENLLARYLALMNTADGKASDGALSIQLLAATMITLVQQRRFAAVHTCWHKALSLAIGKGRQKNLDLSDSTAELDSGRSSLTRPDASGISLQSDAENSEEKLVNPFLDRGGERILAAHRYSLAAPLTQYMHALSAQNLVANLPPLVKGLEEMGFSLTSKNWNHYLQVLSYSNESDLQLLAFRIFEEKLLPNMPPWHLMKRSKWSQRRIVDGSGDVVIEEPVQRKLVEKYRPHTLVPTYWTMVYLGLALMKAQHRDLIGETSGLSVLRNQAPGALDAVSRMPYLREKAQGLLLRGRTLQGDLQRRPRRPPEADRAGLRGSRSPLDHIPLGFPNHELNRVLKGKQVLDIKQAEVEPRVPVRTAEALSGEIQRNPLVLEAAGRYERDQEYLRRLRAEENEKLRLLEQMRDDAAQSRLMADEKFGEPFFEAKLHGQHTSSTASNTTDSQAKEQQDLLSSAMDHFVDTKKRIPRQKASYVGSDNRPAAMLSAARRPKAAERLHVIRRRRRRGPAIALSMAAFRRNLPRKLTLALNAYQPRLKIPNRLRRKFTKNKAARRARNQTRASERPKRKDDLQSDLSVSSSAVGESHDR